MPAPGTECSTSMYCFSPSRALELCFVLVGQEVVRVSPKCHGTEWQPLEDEDLKILEERGTPIRRPLSLDHLGVLCGLRPL